MVFFINFQFFVNFKSDIIDTLNFNIETSLNGLREKIYLNTTELSKLSKSNPDSSKKSLFLKDKPSYWISGQNLIVWQPISLKAVIIEAVFQDPTDLSDIKMCDKDGVIYDQACYNPLKDEFPMDADIWEEVYMRTFSKLTNSQRVPDDKLNNAETELDRKI